MGQLWYLDNKKQDVLISGVLIRGIPMCMYRVQSAVVTWTSSSFLTSSAFSSLSVSRHNCSSSSVQKSQQNHIQHTHTQASCSVLYCIALGVSWSDYFMYVHHACIQVNVHVHIHANVNCVYMYIHVPLGVQWEDCCTVSPL